MRPLVGALLSLGIPVAVSKSDTVIEEKRRKRSLNFNEKLRRAEAVVQKFKEERGVPGVSVGVSLNGKTIWRTGFGYSDVENLTPCDGYTVMRIASISKPLTMTLAAKLLEQGKLDLDAPVQKYVPSFPEKFVDEEKIDKNSEICNKVKKIEPTPTVSEFELSEYYIQKQYKSVVDALEIFKNDPLLSKPGTKYLYTTHGWTLVSAVLQGASGRKFETMMKEMFAELKMNETYFDENLPLIANRSSYYRRSKKSGVLENVPSVNNSYKLAGGGVLSTVGDLLKFADAMLDSYRSVDRETFLQSETVRKLWTPVVKMGNTGVHYGMGWSITPTTYGRSDDADSKQKQFYVSHKGGAIGCSSILLIKPADADVVNAPRRRPIDVSVVILTNLQECGGLNKLALDIASIFETNRN